MALCMLGIGQIVTSEEKKMVRSVRRVFCLLKVGGLGHNQQTFQAKVFLFMEQFIDTALYSYNNLILPRFKVRFCVSNEHQLCFPFGK